MLYLVRHGRTAANASGLLQGRLDPPLDEIGHEQAQAIAEMVGRADVVISSSLVRAQETAAYFDRPVEVDDRWIELAYGEYEGVPAGEVPPEVWQSWRTNALYATKGGERRTISIVGSDETDTARGYVSWISPVARALTRSREGDVVSLRTPAGADELEVLEVRYVPLATGERPV